MEANSFSSCEIYIHAQYINASTTAVLCTHCRLQMQYLLQTSFPITATVQLTIIPVLDKFRCSQHTLHRLDLGSEYTVVSLPSIIRCSPPVLIGLHTDHVTLPGLLIEPKATMREYIGKCAICQYGIAGFTSQR